MAAPFRVFDTRMQVKFTRDMVERARYRAALRGITFSDLVRQALDRELKRPTPNGRRHG